MKRIFAMLFALVMVNSLFIVSHSEEVFTIHGGLSFGMSKEEVIKYEEGLSDTDKVEFNSDDYYGVGEMMITNQFAGKPSKLYFSFSDNKLVSVVVERLYEYGNKEIRNAIKEKYGDTINEEKRYIYYPSEGYTASDLFQNKDFQKQYSGNQNLLTYDNELELKELDQYIVTVPGGYINIQYIGFSYRTYYMESILGPIDKSREPSNEYKYIISYTFVSDKEMEEYEEFIIQRAEDENRHKEEQKKARENDL